MKLRVGGPRTKKNLRNTVVVGMVTRLRTGRSGVRIPAGARDLSPQIRHFMKIRPVAADRRTDRHDEASRNFGRKKKKPTKNKFKYTNAVNYDTD
jgi:hypothetical protein